MCEQAVRQMTQVPGPGRGTLAQCTRMTVGRPRLLFIPLGALLVLFMGMSGCVPVPYRPSASVSHTPVGADTVAAIEVSSATHRAMAESLAESIHEAEPRIFVDTHPVPDTVFSHGTTLAQILEPAHAADMAARPADYLLTLGPMVHRQLHETGDAAPFPFFPVIWVGYDKRQSVDTLCASFADLHEPQTVDGILVSSPYTEVIAAMVYGFGTIAMSEVPMRRVLAQDVAHRLAAAHPTGEIRLTILAQDGGDEPGRHQCMQEPPKKPLSVDTGMRKPDTSTSASVKSP
jgi:hypothetical protein